MIKAILFDLDETLILDEPISLQAFRDAAAGLGLDPAGLAEAAGTHARRLWLESPDYDYCLRIGHSAWEGLWARYDQGSHPTIAALRAWAPGYRVAAWERALSEHGLPRDEARAAADRFFQARRRFPLYPEIEALLDHIQPLYKLGIVTNGVPDLQREKLAGSGVAHRFQAAVVSGEIDCGKPHPGIFDHICGQLGVTPAECVMVGDNPERDVAGALAAGCKAVWVQRHDRAPDPRYPADLSCTDLSSILPWLADLY